MLSGHHDRRQESGTTEENPGLGIPAEGRGLGIMEERGGLSSSKGLGIMEEGRDLRSTEEEHGGGRGGWDPSRGQRVGDPLLEERGGICTPHGVGFWVRTIKEGFGDMEEGRSGVP